MMVPLATPRRTNYPLHYSEAPRFSRLQIWALPGTAQVSVYPSFLASASGASPEQETRGPWHKCLGTQSLQCCSDIFQQRVLWACIAFQVLGGLRHSGKQGQQEWREASEAIPVPSSLFPPRKVGDL